MVSTEGLCYSFGGDTELKYPDWTVSTGDSAMILGNSGSGKTTLLHLLAGLLAPTKGVIKIEGQPISSHSQTALDRYRRGVVGIIFQKPHLIAALNVKENLLLANKIAKKQINEQQVDAVLDNLGMLPFAKHKPHQLSQGQSQRLSIARAVINHPKLILADEPTANLDDMNCEKVLETLKFQAKKYHATLILATHDQRVKSSFSNCLKL